jgi:hypothetical protein
VAKVTQLHLGFDLNPLYFFEPRMRCPEVDPHILTVRNYSEIVTVYTVVKSGLNCASSGLKFDPDSTFLTCEGPAEGRGGCGLCPRSCPPRMTHVPDLGPVWFTIKNREYSYDLITTCMCSCTTQPHPLLISPPLPSGTALPRQVVSPDL